MSLPTDISFALPQLPARDRAHGFRYGERLFYRLLRFWGALTWPAPGAQQKGITWVELAIFLEIAAGTELPFTSRAEGSRHVRYVYPEDQSQRSPATLMQKAELLARATWALQDRSSQHFASESCYHTNCVQRNPVPSIFDGKSYRANKSCSSHHFASVSCHHTNCVQRNPLSAIFKRNLT